jgi:hypothetical protein
MGYPDLADFDEHFGIGLRPVAGSSSDIRGALPRDGVDLFRTAADDVHRPGLNRDLTAAEQTLILAQVERELDAEVRLRNASTETMMPLKLPYTQAVAGAYGKFIHALETDAQAFIEKDLPAADAYRSTVFANARQKVAEVRSSVGDAVNAMADIETALNATNGAPPTSGDSSGSPAPSPTLPPVANIPVSSNPAENAHLAQVT